MASKQEQSFSNWASQTLSFPSTWKDAREFTVSAAQTDDIIVKDRSETTQYLKEDEAQTDAEKVSTVVQNIQPPYPPSLYAFFAKVTDEVCRCLEENLDPFAIEIFKEVAEDEDLEEIDRETKPKKIFQLRDTELHSELSGRCIAWNKLGSQIAICYAMRSHTGWCSHRVPISCWNLDRTLNFDSNKPHGKVFLPSCATCMEFHPLHPSVLVVGLLSGNVALIDFSSSDNSTKSEEDQSSRDASSETKVHSVSKSFEKLMANMGYFIDSTGHSMAVTAVEWITLTQMQLSNIVTVNPSPSHFCIITSGKDGIICLWSTNTLNSKLVLEKRFIVWSDCIPSNVPAFSRTIYSSLKHLSVLNLTSTRDDPTNFIFVTSEGLLFQGSLESTIEAYAAMTDLPAYTKDRMLFDPNLQYLTKCDGWPCALEFSHCHSDIFLCGTTFGSVSIENVLKPQAREPFVVKKDDSLILDMKWSLRPLMFGAVNGNNLNFFDLKHREKTIFYISGDENFVSLAFNKVKQGVVAACDVKGNIIVWELPLKFSSYEPADFEFLNNYHETKT